MAASYRYAEGGKSSSPPREIQLIRAIDRFGVMAVYGRPVLSVGEIRRLALCENIIAWHAERAGQKDWSKWGRENKHKARTLTQAARLFAQFFPDEIAGEPDEETDTP